MLQTKVEEVIEVVRPIIQQDAGDVVRQSLTIGYEQLLGVVTGDVETWRAAGLPIVASELVRRGPRLRAADDGVLVPGGRDRTI